MGSQLDASAGDHGNAPAPPGAGCGSRAGGRRPRVLVADDNADAARALAQLLELSGYTADVAADGLAAVEMSARLRPDVLLLDVGMPKMTGLEVARWIRGRFGRAQPVLVAVTAWGRDEDRCGTRDAGFDGHFTKAADPDDLLRWLATITDGESPARPPPR